MSNGKVEDVYELSPLQQGILWHSLHDGAADMYLSQQTYAVEGPVDIEVLVGAWRAVTAAHPALRTSFHWEGLDKPLQVVHPQVPLPVEHHDWSGAGERRQQELLADLRARDRAAGFDPAVPPLQRLNVIRLGDGRYSLTWTYHHLLLDGWSIPIVLDEVMARYRGAVAGTAPPPPVPAYRDYIAWLQRQDLRQAQEFWTTALAGIQPSRLALRAAGTENGTGAVERRTVRLPESLTGGLREAAARHRVTFSTLVQATWAIVLHGYTGLPEITFGCATSGRPAELPQVDRMVGLFANTLPLRVTVPGDGDTGPWLRQIQNSHAAMRRYEYSPLADIKKWAGHPGQQLFDSLLVLENYSLAIEADTGQDAETGPVRFSVQALYDKIDLPLTLTIAPDPVSELQLLIHRDRFQPGFTDDILKRLHQTLETIGTTDRIAPVLAAVGSPPVHAVPPPEPGPSRPATPTPPSTPEEHAIAAVYEEILGISGIDVTASFFELGGDSFAAVRAVGRIDGATVSLLAAHPTVRDLARAIAPADPQTDLDAEIADLEQRLAAKQAARQAAEKQPAKPGRVVPVPREGTLPCTYQQEGLWFLSRLDPTSTTYHIPFTLRLRGALDVPALERAVHALVIRHEALRTRFVEHQGRPRQVIEPPPATFSLPVAELTIDEVGRWSATEISRPFDLEAGALFRVNLARLASGEHALVMVVHHIVADGWSSKMLATDLSLLYAAETGVTGVELPALTVQAADYAAWQRGWLDGAELERQMAYWREKLAGLPTVDFPADRIRPSQPTGAGATAARRFADDLAAAARGYTRAEQVSFLAVLQAALLTVLHRYTGQQDLVIGSIFTGRTRPEIEPVVGFFANTLVLRTDIGGEPSFAELVHRSHDTVLNATEHQEVPFGLIVDALQPERVAGRNPLFQISLTLQPASVDAELTLGDVRAVPVASTDSYARFDLLINVGDTEGGLELMAEYSTELFDADRIERLLDHLTAALGNGLAAPGTLAADLEIMSAAERHQVLRAWNDTAAEYPAELVHRLVQATAARTPLAIAVIDHDGTPWTYQQLDRAANQLAHRLRRHGAGPSAPVGICLHRGIGMVTALLAALKAGAGYLPLDPDLPPQRLAFLLADAAPSVVVTHTQGITAAFPAAITLDTDQDSLAAEPATPPDSGATSGSIAYFLYTSGSTGAPKGVPVSHHSLQQHLAWMQDTYRLSPADRVLQKTPYSFDVSVWEFFWPLAVGATLVMAAPGGHRDPAYLHRMIARHDITTVHFVPSMLLAFLDATGDDPDPAALRRLRQVFSSGESLPAAAVHRFQATWPHVDLHNLYGPTEATIDVTAWHCQPGAATIPIGRPIANMRAYVLDRCLRPAPIGCTGQLYTAGPGLAYGYLNWPGLTAEHFLPDPYADQPGQRMYATGDLARWRSDGQLEFFGRIDRQVKLRGERIELGEIEHVLADHPAIRQCAVTLRGDDSLTAYIVTKPGQDTPSFAALREHLFRCLPATMIPTTFVPLPALPLSTNGKLDTASLPDPRSPTDQYVAPRTATERWLATEWQELLGAARVGVRDSFFDLGGNSLHGTRLIARIRDSLHIDLELRHLYTSEILEQLAARVDESQHAPAEQAIVPTARDGALPCTYQQEGLWFLHRLDPTSSMYHISFALRLHGALDIAALERAVRALIARHEALRTRFVEHQGRPRQVIEPPSATFSLPVTELPAGEVSQWADTEIYRPFDLAACPLFRIALARLAPGEHVLVMVVHHIVADGWSARILAGELSLLYAAETGMAEIEALPTPQVQPADHAVWQRGWFDGAELERQVTYWRDKLAGLPTVNFPADRPRPAQPTGAGDVLIRPLPDELATAARVYARASHSSLLAVMQAALLTVLDRYTGQQDLVIGSIFTGRTRPEIEPVVGFFANTLVLRTDIGGEPSFAELVHRCHEIILDATTHQDVPFGLIVDALQPERVAGRNPLFQISLSLQPADIRAGLALGAVAAEPIDLTGGYSRFDIAIDVIEGTNRLDLVTEYSTELFDTDRIERLLDHLTAALANGLAAPGSVADDIDIMTTAERDQVLQAWNPLSGPRFP